MGGCEESGPAKVVYRLRGRDWRGTRRWAGGSWIWSITGLVIQSACVGNRDTDDSREVRIQVVSSLSWGVLGAEGIGVAVRLRAEREGARFIVVVSHGVEMPDVGGVMVHVVLLRILWNAWSSLLRFLFSTVLMPRPISEGLSGDAGDVSG